MPPPDWPPSPARPALDADAVGVWRADLAQAAARGEAERLLVPSERERAARFAAAADGRRWAAARGILRALLGALTDADPHALRFAEGPHGKPALAVGPRGAPALDVRFNLSHSGDVALYAVALGREVGVDLELPRRPVDHVAIARRIFGEREAERLRALDPQAREQAFL